MFSRIKETNIHGLSDLLLAERKSLAIIWCFVIVIAAACTINESVKLINQYRSENIASTISLKSPEKFPVITICPEIWFDLTKMAKYNISKADLKFLLSLSSKFRTTSQQCFVDPEDNDFNTLSQSFSNRHGTMDSSWIRDLMIKIAIDVPLVHEKVDETEMDSSDELPSKLLPSMCPKVGNQQESMSVMKPDAHNNAGNVGMITKDGDQLDLGSEMQQLQIPMDNSNQMNNAPITGEQRNPTHDAAPDGNVLGPSGNRLPENVVDIFTDQNWKHYLKGNYRKKVIINSIGVCFNIEFLSIINSAAISPQIISYYSSSDTLFDSYTPEYDIVYIGNGGLAKSVLSNFEKIPLGSKKKVDLHQTVHVKLQSHASCNEDVEKDYSICPNQCMERKCIARSHCSFIYATENSENQNSKLCSRLSSASKCSPMDVSEICLNRTTNKCDIPCTEHFYEVQVKECNLCMSQIEKGSSLEIEFNDPRNNMVVVEFQTFTWQTLISSLGGILSLFFGASILSLVQMAILVCKGNDSDVKAIEKQQRNDEVGKVIKPISNTNQLAII